MTTNVDIRGALQTQLLTVSGLPEVAYEGIEYTPTPGVPYVVPVVLHGTARPFDIKARAVDNQGSFEIAVCYPATLGTRLAETVADEVIAAFPPGLRVSGLRIRWAERRPAMIDSDWLRVPVSIGWRKSAAA